MLGTLRADGSPRISPVEPNIFEQHLVIVGMPGTRKFRDLGRDPRFELHTATEDAHVTAGDAKLWGVVSNLRDEEFHQGFADDLYERTGFDLRGEKFDPFYVADIRGGSTVQIVDGGMSVQVWEPGQGERTVRKD